QQVDSQAYFAKGRGIVAGVAGTPPEVHDECHPRVQAIVAAARFYGIDLDPKVFSRANNANAPSAAALAAWLRDSGMWARALRLWWRQLSRVPGQDPGPCVLLFADAPAGLLTAVNAEKNVAFLKDPRTGTSGAHVVVDQTRLEQVWSGETI